MLYCWNIIMFYYNFYLHSDRSEFIQNLHANIVFKAFRLFQFLAWMQKAC